MPCLCGVQYSLKPISSLQLCHNAPVPFNNAISVLDNCITYNGICSEFKLNEVGNYYVSWSVNVAHAVNPCVPCVGFAIHTNPASPVEYIPKCVTGCNTTVYGNALLSVTKPTTLKLINYTCSDIVLSCCDATADIVIIKLC